MTEEEISEYVRNRIKITYVGHSLGGMFLPMYIIYSRLLKRDHFLSKAILLAPAGTHFHANWVIKRFGQLCTYVLPIFADGAYVPDFFMTAAHKLMNDVKELPATNDFVTYLTSQLWGGPSHGRLAVVTKSSKIFASTVHFGFS